MKNIFKLCILFFFVCSAHAVSLQFKVDVTSSGPSIYACDAGIKHAAHPQRVCFDRKTGNSCNPKNCASVQNCSCVCTGGDAAGDGEYRFDFMRANHSAWVDNGETTPSVNSTNMYSSPTVFNRIFSTDSEWDNVLHSLEFNLGSERYGAEMYLDICYRGPQIEYYANQAEAPSFLLKAQATVTDIVTNNGLKYSQLSDLKVRVDATCDVQGLGSFVYAYGNVNEHTNNGNHYGNDGNNGNSDGNGSNNGNHYGQLKSLVAHTINADMTGGDASFRYPLSGYTNFNGNMELLLNNWINVNNAYVPRFCKVRYTFIENRRNDSNLMAQIRKWNLQKAQICTYTEIQGSSAN